MAVFFLHTDNYLSDLKKEYIRKRILGVKNEKGGFILFPLLPYISYNPFIDYLSGFI